MKQIIVLDTQLVPGIGTSVNYIFWYPVAAGREIPRGAGSSYKNASAPELTALQNGQVVEEVLNRQFISGTTAVSVKAQLVAEYAVRAATFAAKPDPNQFFGLFYENAAWSA